MPSALQAKRERSAPAASPVAPPVKGVRLYAAPILLSAFLLFLVQPMLAKAILPWFGGVASVWIVVMLFFQSVLLLGYVYSYLTVRFLPVRLQPVLHLVLLAGTLLLLPVNPWRFWHGEITGDPSIAILRLLVMTVGMPYLVLSSTGPLIQAWYSRSHGVAFPYRLFALSNLGSLAALFAYPFAIEPFITTRHQVQTWSVLYAIFAVLCGIAAGYFWMKSGKPSLVPEAEVTPEEAAPSRRDYLLWTALAACGSALLVTAMNHLCQNVAPIPLLWILPMACYLLTFILCFDRQGWYRPAVIRWVLPFALAAMMFGIFYPTDLPGAAVVILLYLACMFAGCLFAHGELARRKPHSAHLTGYYLTIALGGVIASIIICLIAPRITDWQVEFPVTLLVCGLLALRTLYNPARWPTRAAGLAMLGFLGLLAGGTIHPVWMKNVPNKVVLRARSFYSVLSVADTFPFEIETLPLRVLRHGWTLHGSQVLSPKFEELPGAYYGPKSGPGMLLTGRPGNWNVGVIGLGTGTLAAYGRTGDSFTFYEIDPLIAHIARNDFRYIGKSRAKVDIVIGDGRLNVQKAPPGRFNLLAVDAFSNDSIPVHLLTREAFEIYFSKLDPRGVIAIHISNRFVDLLPVLARISDTLGKQAIFVHSLKNGTTGALDADWVLIANQPSAFDALPRGAGTPLPPAPPGFDVWTDDYSNLVQLLR